MKRYTTFECSFDELERRLLPFARAGWVLFQAFRPEYSAFYQVILERDAP